MSFDVLIAGLGQIGMGYDLHLDPAGYVYSHARAFSLHPDFRLIAGVDQDAQRCATFAKAYQCPAYADVADALHHHQPELVVIAVPTHLHGRVLQRVLEQSNPRAILCEKPLSYDLQEARDMALACAARGVRLYVNYMRRSTPGAIEIKRRLDSGEIATPVKGVAWYSKGFLHNGSHFFNLLEYWLGPMQRSAVLNRGRLSNDNDGEPDVLVTFLRGEIAFLAAWEDAFSHHTLELLSRNGRLRCERGGEQLQWETARADPQFPGYTVLSGSRETIQSGMERYQWLVAEQLARALNGRDAHLCSSADALQTLAAMKKILEREQP